MKMDEKDGTMRRTPSQPQNKGQRDGEKSKMPREREDGQLSRPAETIVTRVSLPAHLSNTATSNKQTAD